MAHIPPTARRVFNFGLAVMRRFQGPNCLVFSRSDDPPIPGLNASENDREPSAVEPVGGGKKRELVGISKRSSLNLVRLCSVLDWSKNGQCLHVSLTYGRQHPRTKEELALQKSYLSKELGQAGHCGLWRLEYQARETVTEKAVRVASGAKRVKGGGGSNFVPHWHLLLWVGSQDALVVEGWLRLWWKQRSGNTSFRGVKVTTGNARGAWYLALHAGKRNQSPPFVVGRWWGYVNKVRVLSATDVHQTGDIGSRELVWYARLYRRATGARTRNSKGFTWFLPRAYQYEIFAWLRTQIAAEKEQRNASGTCSALTPLVRSLVHRKMLRCETGFTKF